MNKTFDTAKKLTAKLLDSDNSGHGMDHTNRVVALALKFAEDEARVESTKANPEAKVSSEVVALAALLHDVDDYKLFGEDSAKNLTNAKNILDESGASKETKDQVLAIIKTIGYNKRLAEITPDTLEGKLVSDADMCDGSGAIGLLRSYQYNLAHGGAFFDRNVFPTPDMTAEEYKKKPADTVVNHMFEKILKLKDLMLTEPGKQEAKKRHAFIVSFLRQYFEEENAPDWLEYLDDYLLMP